MTQTCPKCGEPLAIEATADDPPVPTTVHQCAVDDLDAFIAQHLIGWTPPFVPLPGDTERTFKPDQWFDETGWSTGYPAYSTSWEGAGSVIDALLERGWGLSSLWWDADGYGAEFVNAGGLSARGASCPRAPRAICLAARAALEAAAPTDKEGR